MSIDVLSKTFSNKPIAHAKDLLDALSKMMSSPTLHDKDPPSATLRFIERIESADPYSPEIDEDNTDISWGHWQFTAAGITLRSVLKTWSDVGDVPTAYRLIATTLKTCLVARHLCFVNKISVQSSEYLSDIYLQEVIGNLWMMVSDMESRANPVSHIFPNITSPIPILTNLP